MFSLRTIIRLSLITIMIATSLGLSAAPAFADLKGLDFSVGSKVGLPDDANPQQRIGNLIVAIINIMLSLAAVLAVGAIIWGAVILILSIGDEKRVGTAKKIILSAIAGLIIIGLSFIIVRFIGQKLGVLGGAGPAGQPQQPQPAGGGAPIRPDPNLILPGGQPDPNQSNV